VGRAHGFVWVGMAAVVAGATCLAGCGSGRGTVRVAAIQCHSTFGDPAANRAKLAGMIARAARKGAKIVVLPETAVTGYLSADLKTTWQVPGRDISPGLNGADPAGAAETVPGPSTAFFGRLADRWNIYLTVTLL